jgi:hypothetical protein
MKKRLFLFTFLFIQAFITFSTNLPLVYNITNYGTKDYKGSSQNWDLYLDSACVYVANNEGLLIYDGNNWSKYKFSHNAECKIKAIQKVGDKIYTAGDNNIGYWVKNSKRQWEYVSLMDTFTNPKIQGENFWSIASFNNNIYFQSFSCILKYDGTCMEEISKSCHMLLQKCNSGLYTHRLFEGIQKIENNKFSQVLQEKYLENDELKFMCELSDGSWIMGSNKGKVLKKEKDNIIHMKNISEVLYPYMIDCGAIMDEKYIIIGTLGGGIYIFNMEGDFINRISGSEGLQSNIIHRIRVIGEDLWVTLDSGVSHIKINPTIAIWKQTKEIGKIADAITINNQILIGTNQGLYHINGYTHQLIPEIRGEVFSLTSIKDKIICSSQDGCFLKDEKNEKWKRISDIKGVSKFEYIAENGKEYLIAPSFTYITYFKYENNTWIEHSQVRNFLNSLSKVMPESTNVIWAIHPTKGIYRIKMNHKLDKTESITNFKDLEGLTDFSHINMARIDGRVLFFSSKGVYSYDIESNCFIKNQKLSRDIPLTGYSTYMSHTHGNEYWFTNGNELQVYNINGNNGKLIGHISYDDYQLTPIKEKNIVRSLNNEIYVGSSVEGIVLINKNNIIKPNQLDKKPMLMHISYFDNGRKFAIIKNNSVELPNNASDIEIYISKPICSKSHILRYRIKSDNNSNWSEWSKNGIITFRILPTGNHAIEIQDYTGNSLVINLIIRPHFFKSNLAIVLYIIIISFVVFYITRRYQHIKREKIIRIYEEEKRRKDEEITKLTNEQLKETIHVQQNEINEKLRAISQKQELLINIGNELDKQKKELGDRYPKKMYEKLKRIITEGMNTEKDFLLFQNYYQEINHEFMLRLKDKHEILTSSELKFCCLIRSNLSTKDIAAILNITTRGVELKRYRLKKKLNLDEENLYDYILKL